MLFDPASGLEALETLLDHERKMILAGRIEDLARSTRQKELLLARLGPSDDEAALARVRMKARRNQALLEAAASGLRSARDRIGAIKSGSAAIRTYDADGTARNLGRHTGTTGVNHRA